MRMSELGKDTERKVQPDGTVLWYRQGVLHRDNGPAVECPNGEQRWFQSGREHRENGPAIVRPNGSRQWFRDGKLHREDGPAVDGPDGAKKWYLNGEPWPDGPSVVARQRAAKAGANKDDGGR